MHYKHLAVKCSRIITIIHIWAHVLRLFYIFYSIYTKYVYFPYFCRSIKISWDSLFQINNIFFGCSTEVFLKGLLHKFLDLFSSMNLYVIPYALDSQPEMPHFLRNPNRKVITFRISSLGKFSLYFPSIVVIGRWQYFLYGYLQRREVFWGKNSKCFVIQQFTVLKLWPWLISRCLWLWTITK